MNDQKRKVLFLSRDEVSGCLPSMSDSINLMESVFIAHAKNQANLPDPAKLSLNLRPKVNAHLTAIPGFVNMEKISTAGLKWLSNFPDNPMTSRLPSISAMIVLNDIKNGLPLAIMEATEISGLRTGAASGVAIRYLGIKKPSCVTLIGASAQGRYQLRAAISEAEVEIIRIYDINPDATNSLVQEMQDELSVPMERANSPDEAVKDANLIIIATTATEPHFDVLWTPKSSLLIDISSGPDLIPDSINAADKIIVDNREITKNRGCLVPAFNSGNLKVDDIHSNIGEILMGGRSARKCDDERILCVPMGMGIEDVALGYYVYKEAQNSDLGTEITLY